jgi:hypothetical protein
MGMCYRLAFFLTTYLQQEHDISTNAVVGYAHDQTSPLMASHAWVEIEGKKTDLSLAFTEAPDIQLRGEVSIVDHVYKPGHRYAYHRERNDAANEVIRTMLDDPQCGLVVQQKEAEHANMVKLSRNPVWMRQYPGRRTRRLQLRCACSIDPHLGATVSVKGTPSVSARG